MLRIGMSTTFGFVGCCLLFFMDSPIGTSRLPRVAQIQPSAIGSLLQDRCKNPWQFQKTYPVGQYMWPTARLARVEFSPKTPSKYLNTYLPTYLGSPDLGWISTKKESVRLQLSRIASSTALLSNQHCLLQWQLYMGGLSLQLEVASGRLLLTRRVRAESSPNPMVSW